MKFKVGDKVLVLNFQEGETGEIIPVEDHKELIQGKFKYIVKLDSNGVVWNYREGDIRLLTPLEQLL